jgi:hypothetical protein
MKTIHTLFALAIAGFMSLNAAADSTFQKTDIQTSSTATSTQEAQEIPSLEAAETFSIADWDKELMRSLNTISQYQIEIYNLQGELVMGKQVADLDFVTDADLKRILAKCDFITEKNGTALYLLNQ